MDFSGLGAVPGGFQQGQIAGNQIDQQQLQLADQRAKQVGMQAYFRALQGMMAPQSGQGPQPPAPGQSSAPAQPQPMAMQGGQPVQGADGGIMPPDTQQQPQPTAGQPPMQSSPAAMPQQAGGGGSGGQLSWQGIIQSLKQQNPAASDLELAHAVDHFMPMMTMQNKLEWQQMRNELMMQMGVLRANTQARGQDIRADTTTRGQDVRADTMDNRTQQQREVEQGRSDRFGVSEDRRERSLSQRDQQFQQREDRLERGLQLRSDQGWQRLEQQKQQAQARIAAGDKTRAVTEWRAAVDAQHKLAMEKIQATNANSAMKPADRDKLLKDQNEWYRGEIEKLRNLTTQRGNLSDQGPETGRSVTELPTQAAPPTAPAGGGQPLPAAFKGDADGTRYQKDGKTWVKQGDQLVIENGG